MLGFQFKKPVLGSMPVLDVARLRKQAMEELANAYDSLKSSPLLLLPDLASDPIRANIDSVICKALRLPDLSTLRGLLAQEPLLSQDMRQLGIQD